MLISDQGTLVRTRVSEVSVISRNTAGVRLIRTVVNEHVVGLEPIAEVSEELIDGDLSDETAVGEADTSNQEETND
jgi:DNA gyrase subunit A